MASPTPGPGDASCCCSCDCRLPLGSLDARRRSVKRRLDYMEEDVEDGELGAPPLLADAAAEAEAVVAVLPEALADPTARVEAQDEVAALREALEGQQRAVEELREELEEERAASASAADEAMSMILRLQREKGEALMEARQFRRFAEEKMEHDREELVALEDLLSEREKAIQVLSCEVEAYRRRLLSCGISLDSVDLTAGATALEDADDEGLAPPVWDYPNPEEPRLRCLDDSVLVSEMEKGVVMGESPQRQFSTESFGSMPSGEPTCSGEQQEDSHALDCEEDDGNTSDRVYTIDAVYTRPAPETEEEHYVGTAMGAGCRVGRSCGEEEEVDIKKLDVRLQLLEAERESMRQAIVSMQADKAQLVLLKEIAERFCRDTSVPPVLPPERKLGKKPSLRWWFSFMSLIKAVLETSFLGCSSFMSMIKWIMSFAFWKKKSDRSKYVFGLSNNNVGLLLLLDNAPRIRQLRCHTRMGS